MSKFSFGALALLLLAPTLHAAPNHWQDLSNSRNRGQVETGIRDYLADGQALRDALARAPLESGRDRTARIQLPLPDGRLVEYGVIEAPVMAPAVAARYPQIKSYKLLDSVDGHVVGRLSSSPTGLRAVLRTEQGRVFIDPSDATLQDQVYVSRSRSSGSASAFRCEVHGNQVRNLGNWLGARFKTAQRQEGALLRYDLAVAVTLEYYLYFGGDDMAVMTAINDTITRVNEIYERDLGITLQLVSGAELFEKFDQGLDNNNTSALLPEVKDWIDTRIAGGVNGYDIGHMFSAPPVIGGGIAFLGGVCNADIKAGGVTGLPNPLNDPFDIDYVAHEIGHQFDAEHSFNGTTGSCGSGRWPPSAYEPGSGTTIMGYASLCGAEDLQTSSIATFHAGSIAEINSFVQTQASCFDAQIATAQDMITTNTDPLITATLANRAIPANTPFILDGSSGPDSQGDTLSYQWDQLDAGCPTDSASFGTDNGSNALFRSYLPRAEGWRNFPALGTQLRSRYDKSEILPCQNRDLNFRLTLRDQRSGQDTGDVRLSVEKSAGPFEISNLGTPQAIVAGSGFDVTWDVANTDQAPINCANVDIDLLTFSNGYTSYSILPLASMTPNDGIESVAVLPATSETRTTPSASVARVRVKCSDNVFYDISDADLTVTPSAGPTTVLSDNDYQTRIYSNFALTSLSPPACGPVVDCTPAPPPPPPTDDRSDSGAFDWVWLLLLTGLAALRPCLRREELP